MRKSILFCVIFISISSFSQKGKQQLQLELSANLPLVANQSGYIYATNSHYSSYLYPIKSNTDISEKLGISFRATYGIPMMGNISASAGLCLDYLAYNIRHTEYPIYPSSIAQTASNSLLLIDEPLYQTKAFYIGIPLIGKYSLLDDKLTPHLGFITNFLLFNNQKITSSKIINNTVTTTTNETSRGLYKIIALFETGVSYTIIENIGVTFKYQRAITPIFEKNYIGTDFMHYNIFSLGVSYNLL